LLYFFAASIYSTLEPTIFKDLFSNHSKDYVRSKPNYPRSLFDFLVGLVHRRNLAWDCATGNGQAAVLLSEYFDEVMASDASKEQIDNALPKENIRYAVFPAERTNLADDSVDLITVAQALHWFDLNDFYKEATRVLRENDSHNANASGVIAAWAYGLHSISGEIDNTIHSLYEDILGPYWSKERKIVEDKYQSIPFLFEEIEAPVFKMELDWSLSQLTGYLYTWSSVQKFIHKNNSDPIKQIYNDLAAVWAQRNTSHKKRVVWPIY
jgi:ubiquinone/menaquinone biosynthesis C-methylase UbiE